MTLQQITYTKIGTNRITPRLWIEGVKLAAAGFNRGDRYSIRHDRGTLTIHRSPTGNRKVSGRTRHGKDVPVIDLEMQSLLQSFDPESRVRVTFSADTITVTLHHEDRAIAEREKAFRTALSEKALTEASLFTGAGISTLAIHQAITDAGYKAKVRWVVDTELKYLQVGYSNNYAITDETCAIIGRAEEIEPAYYTPVNILSFSMPCAGFSTAGKSKHKLSAETHDSATSLFGVVNAIRSANPAVLISENVTEAQTAPAYVLLKAELTRLGYCIFERILDSNDTGSVENRRRYWFIAISKGLAQGFQFLTATYGRHTDRRTIADILETDIPEALWSDNTYLKEKAVRDRRDGKGFANRQLLTGEEERCGTIGRHYNKRRSTEPFITREDGSERLFTPVEHARVKSIPEAIIQDVNATNAHEILGQSIDFLQAYLSTASLMRFFSGDSHYTSQDTAENPTSAPDAATGQLAFSL